MRTTARILTAFLTATLSTGMAAASEGPDLYWKGKKYATDALPENFPARVKPAVEYWSTWVQASKYQMDLLPGGEVLLITPEESSRRKNDDRLEIITDVLDLFEEHLPAPERMDENSLDEPGDEQDSDSASNSSGDGPLPEDPEGGPAPWEIVGEPDVKAEEPETWSYSWGATEALPDTEPITFLIVRSKADLAGLLGFLGEGYPYLAEWAKNAASYTGFALEQPLAGSYMEQDDVKEDLEWSPEHELLNRVAQLLMTRRFGRQPYWLTQGWAWFAEIELRGGVYCFPYREEFVFTTEHTSWGNDLRTRYKKRSIGIKDFAKYKRGKYDGGQAKPSWGMVDFLLRHRGDRAPELLEELRVLHIAGSKIDKGDGTWEIDRDYQVPVETQEDLIEKYMGDDCFEEASKYLRDPKKY